MHINFISEQALIETNNAGVEVALEWLILTDGIDDVDSGKDYTKAKKSSLGDRFEEELCESLSEMGTTW